MDPQPTHPQAISPEIREQGFALYHKVGQAHYEGNGEALDRYAADAIAFADAAGDHYITALTLITRLRYALDLERSDLARQDLTAVWKILDERTLTEKEEIIIRKVVNCEEGNDAWTRRQHVDARRYYLASIDYARMDGDENQQAVLYTNLGNVIEEMGDIQAAVGYYTKALEIFPIRQMSEINPQFPSGHIHAKAQYAHLLCSLAETCFTAGDYESAQSYLEESAAIGTTYPRVLAEIYRVSSLLALQRQDLPGALSAAIEATEYAKKIGGLLVRNTSVAQARVHISSGNTETAIGLLHEALTTFTFNPYVDCQVNALLGLCYAKRSSDKATEHVAIAQALLSQVSEIDAAGCMLIISETKWMLGDAVGAYELLQRSNETRERVYSAKVRNEIGSLRLLVKIERDQHDREIEQMKRAQIEKQLASTTVHLAMQTELLASFRNELRHIVREMDEPMNALRKIKEKLKALPCEQIDWLKFEREFTSVHPEFKAKLEDRYPELTKQEVKMCQLARLGLKNIEMAQLLCLSERSVEGHRLNLRKKIGLKTGQDLAEYLSAIS